MGKETCVYVVVFSVFSCLSLAYGIAEAVILSGSKDVKSEDCTNAAIWYNILVTCILHFISFVSLAFGACLVTGDSDSQKGGESSLIGLGVAIWSCVIYFETSKDCADFLDDNYHHLWQAVLAEIVLFFVMIGMIVIMCGGACCIFCCSKEKPEARTGSSNV